VIGEKFRQGTRNLEKKNGERGAYPEGKRREIATYSG